MCELMGYVSPYDSFEFLSGLLVVNSGQLFQGLGV